MKKFYLGLVVLGAATQVCAVQNYDAAKTEQLRTGLQKLLDAKTVQESAELETFPFLRDLVNLVRQGANPNISVVRSGTDHNRTFLHILTSFLETALTRPSVFAAQLERGLITQKEIAEYYGSFPSVIELESLVRDLLAVGANPNIRNKAGQTPIFFAGLSPKVVRLFINKGANLQVKDSWVKTPYEHITNWHQNILAGDNQELKDRLNQSLAIIKEHMSK